MIKINCYHVSKIRTNCYVIFNEETKEAAIIDPGGESSHLTQFINSFGKNNFKYILLTHGHFDHISAADSYRKLTGAKICISKKEIDFLNNSSLNLSNKLSRKEITPFNADILLNDTDSLEFANTYINIMSTPGHTIGSVCYFIDDIIFSGDTLFFNSHGRTDLPTGNEKDLNKSLSDLFSLNKNYVVYPGHGEKTTLNEERLKRKIF